MRRARALALLVLAVATGCAESRRDEEAPGVKVEAPVALGRTERERGRTWAALWRFTRAAHENPEDPASRAELGLTFYGLGSYPEVCAALEELARIRPLDQQEKVLLADSYLRTKQTVAADSLFTLVLETEGGRDPRVLEARGAARRQLGRMDDAIRDFESALALDQSYEGARLYLAEAQADRGDPTAARVTLEAFASLPADSARFHAITGRVHSRLGDSETAIRHLEAAARIDPFRTSAHHLLAEARRRAGDREGARAAAARHAELRNELRPLATGRAGAAVIDAVRALEAGDEEGALAILTRGLADDPRHEGLHSIRGPLLRARGDAKGARESFDVLRQLTQGANPGPLFLATGKELRRRGYLHTAARQFQIAANRMKGDEEATFWQALALLEAGDERAAYEAAAPLEVTR